MCPRRGSQISITDKTVLGPHSLSKRFKAGPCFEDERRHVILVAAEDNCWDDGVAEVIGPYASKKAAWRALNELEKRRPNMLSDVKPIRTRIPKG